MTTKQCDKIQKLKKMQELSYEETNIKQLTKEDNSTI